MTFALVLLAGLIAPAVGIEERVAAYWDLLLAKDKAEAIEFVARESRNAFIRRREPAMRSWRPLGVQPRSDFEALVTVEVEQAFPGVAGFHRVRLVETWILEEDRWRVKVVGIDPERALTQFQAPKTETPPPGRLEVVPEVLRIHFLDRLQTGGVRIANGLEAPVEIERLEFDRDRFRLKEGLRRVGPSSYGKIVLEYVGGEIAKDRPSRLTVFARVGGRDRIFRIPIVYNYLSPGARALFGLDAERAEKLKRGDPLRPALPTPASAAPPEALEKILESRRPPERP